MCCKPKQEAILQSTQHDLQNNKKSPFLGGSNGQDCGYDSSSAEYIAPFLAEGQFL